MAAAGAITGVLLWAAPDSLAAAVPVHFSAEERTVAESSLQAARNVGAEELEAAVVSAPDVSAAAPSPRAESIDRGAALGDVSSAQLFGAAAEPSAALSRALRPSLPFGLAWLAPSCGPVGAVVSLVWSVFWLVGVLIVLSPLILYGVAKLTAVPLAETAARLLPGSEQKLASEDANPQERAEQVAARREKYPTRKGVTYDFSGGEDGKPVVPYDTPVSANVQHVMPRVVFVDVTGPDGTSFETGYVPDEQRYTVAYKYKDVQALANLVVGRLGFVDSFPTIIRNLMSAVVSLVTKPLGVRADTFDSIERYTQLFSPAVGPPKALKDSYWDDDEYFGTQRLSGVNPVMIKRVASKAVEGDIGSDRLPALADVPGCDTASLEALAGKGDLFIVDYARILNADTGDKPTPHSYCTLSDADLYRTRRHLPAPLALFEHATGEGGFDVLRPLAIVIEGEAFWPAMGSGNQPHPAWQVAKQYVQAADGTIHEARSHLGRTHLVIEPVAAAFARNMPPAHPLFQLMAVHTQMMVSKNRDAVYALAQPGGFVNELLGPTVMTEGYAAVDEAVATWSITQYALFNELSNRGFDCAVAATGDHTHFIAAPSDSLSYPYRDDGVDVWNAINRYVKSAVDGIYGDDAAMRADAELGAVIDDFRDEGEGGCTVYWDGVQGDYAADRDPSAMRPFPALASLTKADLCLALTTAIYTSSFYHSVVNYGQYEAFAFTPSQPLAVFREADYVKGLKGCGDLGALDDPAVAERYTLPPLPPARSARVVVTIIDALTAFRYDRMGYQPYGPFLPFNGLFRLLPDPFVAASVWAARRFQRRNARGWEGSKLEKPSDELVDELERLEGEFARRNEKRHPKYNQFQVGLPSNVLNSISI